MTSNHHIAGKRAKDESEVDTSESISSTAPAFILKTYKILQDPKNSAIISWSPSGTEFVIKDPSEFAEKILPHHFKHKNYTSFVRQLNMYGFHKSRDSGNVDCFSHPLFRQGASQLLPGIRRKKNLDFDSFGSGLGRDKKLLKEYVQTVTKLQEGHKKLEERVANLETLNKEYASRYTYIMGECYKMNEKNQQLEKLVHCLTSMLAIQGCGGYREIPGADAPMSFKKESMMVMRKMLMESLKGLGAYTNGFDPAFLRKKSIMGVPPMIDNGPSFTEEEAKEQESRRFSIEYEDNGEPIIGHLESSIPPSPNLRLSPLPSSVPLSPLNSSHELDPGMSIDPLPNYFQHSDMQPHPSNSILSLQEYKPQNPYELFGHKSSNEQTKNQNKRQCAEVETLSSHSEGRRTPEQSNSYSHLKN